MRQEEVRRSVAAAVAGVLGTIVLVACAQQPRAARSRVETTSRATTTSAPSPSTSIVRPLSRAALLQWGAHCRGTASLDARSADPIICFQNDLPAADRPSLAAACNGLALRAHQVPTASIFAQYDGSKVRLNCDQGTPAEDYTTILSQLHGERGAPDPPRDYVDLRIDVPAAGTSLDTASDHCPSGRVCMPLTDGQRGYEMRELWYYEAGGQVVPLVVNKPTVLISLSRSYAYNHGEIEQRQMIADQAILIRALGQVDTAAGFHVITSTAHAHD